MSLRFCFYDMIDCMNDLKQFHVVTEYLRKLLHLHQTSHRWYHPSFLLFIHVCILLSITSLIHHPSQHQDHKSCPLPLTFSFLFSVTSEMWHLMAPPPTPSDARAGTVANARDRAKLLQERQLIKPGNQPSRVWQFSIYHRRTGARVKLETPLLLTPRC